MTYARPRIGKSAPAVDAIRRAQDNDGVSLVDAIIIPLILFPTPLACKAIGYLEIRPSH